MRENGSGQVPRQAEGSKARGEAYPLGVPRLLLWKRDVAAMLGMGGRTLERMISRGQIPPPDRRLRGRPAWLPETIKAWVEQGCPSISS